MTNEFGEATGESPKLEIRLQRTVRKQQGNPHEQIETIARSAIANIRRFWYIEVRMQPTQENKDGSKTHFGTILVFRSQVPRGREEEDIKLIRSEVTRECVKGNYRAIPWIEIGEDGKPVTNFETTDYMNDPFEGEFITFAQYKEYFDARKDHLWNASDEVISDHPLFAGIYGLGAQIRMCMDAIYQAVETEGSVCHHILLWGEPGAAKTTLGLALCEWLQACIPADQGVKSSVWLNIDSSTNAGLRDSFLKKWSTTGIPPFIGFEEAEKVDESVWKSMLGALDSRQRIMILNARRATSTSTKFLGIAIVNNKALFDKFLGGTTENGEFRAGALSSRFSTKIEVARPDYDTMKDILLREIDKYGWNEEWADAAMDIAERLKTNDPREIMRFLDGKERLLDSSYLADILKTRMARENNKRTYNMEKEVQTNDFWNDIAKEKIALEKRYRKGIFADEDDD